MKKMFVREVIIGKVSEVKLLLAIELVSVMGDDGKDESMSTSVVEHVVFGNRPTVKATWHGFTRPWEVVRS